MPHRCLQIPEIVDLIFECVRYLPWPEFTTLTALARTCKAFHEPAIKHLWRDLPTLRPIFSILPESAWQIQEEEGQSMLYPVILFEELVGAALPRLSNHTRHVRRIECKVFWPSPKQNNKRYAIHYSIIQALRNHPSLPHPLFPNVRHVGLFSDVRRPLASVFSPALILSPSVESISIATGTSLERDIVDGSWTPPDVTTPDWLGLAGRLADVASQLSSFRVEMLPLLINDPRWAGRIPALLEAFTEFSHRLSRLDIVPLVVTVPAIMAIGQLKGLTELNLSLFGFQLDELDALRVFSLVALDQVTVNTNSLATCIKFFQALRARALSSLVLSCYIEDDTDLTDFFSALRDRGTYGRLKSITVERLHLDISDEPNWRDLDEQPCFTFTQLTAESLVSLKNIENLSIGPVRTLQIADSDIQEMFGSWPSLKVFELDDDVLVDEYQVPRLTLAGVHKALQTVPQLEKLTLSFDGSILPSSLASTTADAQPHPALTTWNVCSSSIALPTKLATWLSSHYPLLSVLEFFKAYLDGLFWTFRHHIVSDWDDDIMDMDSFAEAAIMVDRWTSVRASIRAKPR
ncbi:hypothetical protein BKA70DRAFT_1132967 [Coprinopsis sp. MPI-PUGE-AT-0042]|nr:hypothetical protein BKA70DRAFT_1132967 [Coprinopsis sp. MPI-PUGE-AT-0042]